MPIFCYGEKEIDALKRCDRVLGRAIDRIGPIAREVTSDLFAALTKAIVDQQISTKAGQTIYARMQALLGTIAPETVCACPANDLQRCGLSHRKVFYIQRAAEKVQSGVLDLEALHALPDEDVCAALVDLDGVGRWTAEMLMLFSMQRPDILSFGDLAIHRGLRMLYRHQEVPRERFERYRRRFSPYGSVASLYLWAIAGGAITELTDPAVEKAMGIKRKAASNGTKKTPIVHEA